MSKYKDGINTMTGDKGGQLSGGQKQRIALARAFIKNPKMLIFDEATSALDKKNEEEVQKAIDQMKKEMGAVTSIVIAHRLSTIKRADRIVVMKKGKIVEDGTHDSLLEDYPNGVYAKLVSEAQSAEMEEEDAGPVDPDKMRPNIAPTEGGPVQIQVQLGNNPFGGKS